MKYKRVLLLLVLIIFYGNLFSQSISTTYEYDELNRLVKVDYPNGQRVEYAYDALGNRISRTVSQLYVSQPVEICEGWTWWAPTVEREVLLDLMETALGTNGIRIDSQDSGSAEQNDGSWNGNLSGLTPGQMYKIKANTSCTLSLLGLPVTTATVTINQDENWFGFIGSEKTVAAAFANFTPTEGDKVISQDEGFSVFENGEWHGTLETLQPGKGYVYVSNATEPKTLVIGN